jgi:hypothetical protein
VLIMKKLILFLITCLAALFWNASADAKLYIAEPALVTQPSYAGMRFYVYKPYDMPKNWYVTFDGYPVYKNGDGLWVYGTFAGPNLTPTHYVVGSVVPSAAGLTPYANPVQISSISSLPQLVMQAPPIMADYPITHSTYIPDWLFNGRFMALGRWKDSVDRIGILHGPNVPVAWRGDHPKVIYAWNGYSWHQMMAREGERPDRVLKNNLYTLTKQVNHHGFIWFEADMPVLSQQAGQWGYYWMGEIIPR